MIRHVLISGTYEAADAIPSHVFSGTFKDTVDAAEGEPIACVAYTTHYTRNPISLGLKDVWMAMTDDRRVIFGQQYPELLEAIHILLLGSEVHS